VQIDLASSVSPVRAHQGGTWRARDGRPPTGSKTIRPPCG